MDAILLIVATMAGGYGIAYAVPQIDIATCEKSSAEVRMMNNMGIKIEDVTKECISKDEFLKRIGERRA